MSNADTNPIDPTRQRRAARRLGGAHSNAPQSDVQLLRDIRTINQSVGAQAVHTSVADPTRVRRALRAAGS